MSNIYMDPYTDEKMKRKIMDEMTRLMRGPKDDAWLYGTDFGPGSSTSTISPASSELQELRKNLQEMTDTLNRIKEEPLVLQIVTKISKDKKHTFFKKGDTEIRVKAVDKLKLGDQVLLHPKTFQIVEHIGRPPAKPSRFVPETTPNVDWDDIIGLEVAKKDLREAVEMPYKYRELFKFYGRPGIKGVLMSGAPGCGKTMLGKALATSLKKMSENDADSVNGFLYVKGPEILDKFVGSSEDTIAELFSDARTHKEEHGYPAIVFIDEADAILGARSMGGFSMSNTIVPAFLTEMDGLEDSGAIVVLATNRSDVIDPAILRDGRIDRKIVIGRPGEKEAKALLALTMRDLPIENHRQEMDVMNDKLLDSKDGLIDSVVEMLYSFECRVHDGLLLRDIISGALLVNCVNIAVSEAIQRDIVSNKKVVTKGAGVRKEDFIVAIDRIRTGYAGLRQ